VAADAGHDVVERYDRAARFGEWNASQLLVNADLQPHWSPDGSALWYGLEREHGRELVVRRARNGAVLASIDAEKFLQDIAPQTGLQPTWSALLASMPELQPDGRHLDLSGNERRWRCDVGSRMCQALPGTATRAGDAVSPDGRWAAFVRRHNLWVRDLATGQERPLTTDGQPDRAWALPTARAAGILGAVPVRERLPPAVIWSPDSRRLLTVRLDETALSEISVVEQVPRDQLLPRVTKFRYGFAVESGDAREELFVIDVTTGSITRVQIETEPLGLDSTIALRRAWWRPDGRGLAIAMVPLSERWADVYVVDPESGAARRLFRDDAARKVYLSTMRSFAPAVTMLSNGDLVWYSTRDGFGHLYRVDGKSGVVIRQLSRGPWSVHSVLHVDERRGWLYFTAGGDTYGPEPYFAAVWRVRLDGSALARITPEVADHSVRPPSSGLGRVPTLPSANGFAPGGRHFVDTYSTPLDPEVTVLRDSAGQVIAELARAQLSPIIAGRYRAAERFTVPAPEGLEALHGVLLFPSDFDPGKRYPVIDAIYNGPQAVEHPRRFSRTVFSEAQSLAELGFVVLVMDARGTPMRSRSFHEYSIDRSDQVATLADHVHVLRQLAKTRPFLDLGRVGITGTSNGGYAALRAMLAFPEVYTVGVACNGSHDIRKYMPAAVGVGEAREPGSDPEKALAHRANQDFVGALQGRLLLILGGVDTNVPAAASYGVMQALIDAGKDFDVVIVPRMGHGMSFDTFAVRKQWDYFVQHLRGETPPRDYRMPDFRSVGNDRH
jgi:dipeptidyl aminopeptidase/acylaminoacyl peptidase